MNNEDVKGLDIKKGLAIVANNKTVYARLLQSFLNNAFCEQLIEAVKDGDMDLVRQKAHSLKGVAGNMHMYELFELSRSIEADAKEGAPLPTVYDKIDRISDANKVTTASINMILNNPGLLDSY